MKTIYPLNDDTWNVNGQIKKVKKGDPVLFKNEPRADFFVSVGRASEEAPKAVVKAAPKLDDTGDQDEKPKRGRKPKSEDAE